jgi:hypothetical protein
MTVYGFQYEILAKLTIDTLRNAGKYTGDIIVFTDNPNWLNGIKATPVIMSRQRFGKAHPATYRFMIADFIDTSKYDQIMYLDSDILCLKDIEPLFTAKDCLKYTKENFLLDQSENNYRCFSVRDRIKYGKELVINSGQFCIDSKYFKDYLKIILNQVTDQYIHIFCADQSAFNVCLYKGFIIGEPWNAGLVEFTIDEGKIIDPILKHYNINKKNFIVDYLKNKDIRNKDITYSFCTCCMNRFHHIKETLPVNLELLREYPNCNIVLLNYNSTDGLDEWIKSNYANEKQLIYLKTNEPKKWSEPHATNVCAFNSTGEFVINLLGDNYLTKEYLSEIFYLTSVEKDIVLRPHTLESAGKIVIRSETFKALGGWDERMSGLMKIDDDFIERSKLYGCKFMTSHHCKYISHGNDERVKNIEINNYNDALRYNATIYEANRKSGVINPNIVNGIDPGKCLLS